MKVSELIELLKNYPQDLSVVVPMYSDQIELEKKHVVLEQYCSPRNDGWVESKRPDKPCYNYVYIGY